jgi:hypothetical protein
MLTLEQQLEIEESLRETFLDAWYSVSKPSGREIKECMREYIKGFNNDKYEIHLN